MKNKSKIIIGILLFFKINLSQAQWTKINSIPSQEIVGLGELNKTLFAASGSNILYRSMDEGISWSPIPVSNDPVENFSLKVIDNSIFIGTISSGIFCSTDNGASWKNWNNIKLPVTGFEKFGARIYASTMGSGVFFYDSHNDTWQPLNNQLPIYSFNVTSLTSTSKDLIIGAGGNGTFYTYDFILNQWTEKYYYGNLLPGLIIDDMLSLSDTLFAVSGNRIIRSNDGGGIWADDKTGSRKGFVRNIYSGAHNHYTITNLLTGGTWIQERYLHASMGSNWSSNEELIPSGYTYDIIEFKSKLFLAREDGLYVKEVVVDVKSPVNREKQIKIFPNPSNGENIKVSCPVNIEKIIIRNSLGQTLYSQTVLEKVFEIQKHFNRGIYMITIILSDHQVFCTNLAVE